MKVQTELVKESLKQESLLARDFDFAFYKKVTHPHHHMFPANRCKVWLSISWSLQELFSERTIPPFAASTSPC